MESAVEADLHQLRLIFALYERYDRSIDTVDIYDEITARLREELDYEREARHMGLYRDMLRDEPGVHVPEVVPELSTGRLLTMTWLEGEPLLELQGRSPGATRDQLALHMFRAWYVPFYDYGVIHGDPHLGNYTVRPDDLDVNLLDFGCIRIFPPRFVKGVIDLYRALDDATTAICAVSAYETWGFSNLDARDDRRAQSLGGVPLRPADGGPHAAHPGDQQRRPGRRIAESVHRRAAPRRRRAPPREFVFMDRAAIGLGSVFLHLQRRGQLAPAVQGA